ncbi:MAG: hypothetical protein K6F50_06615 [Kiritimatiellae bacterium]|nr:hypothetical protein [Kiritimatiellia bacterium]
MRASRRNAVWALAFSALLLLGATLGLLFEVEQGRYFWNIRPFEWFCGDLGVRHAEIGLAHRGINSFRIWNCDIVVPGYTGMSRPDKEPPPGAGGQPVHAYPAWHTCFCWFYGWISMPALENAAKALFALAVVFLFFEFRRVDAEYPSAVSLAVLASASIPAAQCWYWMNYGVLIVALFALVERCRASGKDIMAGLLWALAMIKPQMAILAFWPLFFAKAYRTIAVAVLACLAGTCFTAWQVHESPVELLLQLPQIGAPYFGAHPMYFIARHLQGGLAMKLFSFAWMGLCFVSCGWLCFRMRGNKEWWYRWAPVALIVPIWNYSQSHDKAILAIWFAVVASEIMRSGHLRRSIWTVYAAMSGIVLASRPTLLLLQFRGIVSPEAVGFVPDVLFASWIGVSLAFLLCVSGKDQKRENVQCSLN